VHDIRVAMEVIQEWIADHPAKNTKDAPLFRSQRSEQGISVAALNHMVKHWCAKAGLKGNYGSPAAADQLCDPLIIDFSFVTASLETIPASSVMPAWPGR